MAAKSTPFNKLDPADQHSRRLQNTVDAAEAKGDIAAIEKAHREQDLWNALSASQRQSRAYDTELLHGHDSRSYLKRFRAAAGSIVSSIASPAQRAATARFDDQNAADALNAGNMTTQLLSTVEENLADIPASRRKDSRTGQRRSLLDYLSAPKDIASGLFHRGGVVKTGIVGAAAIGAAEAAHAAGYENTVTRAVDGGLKSAAGLVHNAVAGQPRELLYPHGAPPPKGTKSFSPESFRLPADERDAIDQALAKIYGPEGLPNRPPTGAFIHTPDTDDPRAPGLTPAAYDLTGRFRWYTGEDGQTHDLKTMSARETADLVRSTGQEPMSLANGNFSAALNRKMLESDMARRARPPAEPAPAQGAAGLYANLDLSPPGGGPAKPYAGIGGREMTGAQIMASAAAVNSPAGDALMGPGSWATAQADLARRDAERARQDQQDREFNAKRNAGLTSREAAPSSP